MRSFTRFFALCLCGACAQAPSTTPPSDAIRLNQLGFYPDGPKTAALVDAEATRFYITTPDQQDTVFDGDLSAARQASYSPRRVRLADFSALRDTGTFVLVIPEVGASTPFRIGEAVYREVTRASIKAFYFQRASTDLPERYAGSWQRPGGHPDTQVKVHASAASPERPEGTVLSSPRGWYDAGDYNKYVVNSGITMGTLLSLYEDFPDHFAHVSLNLPESGNPLPDLLDEVLWNLRWMLTMQDPHDGGVYHKLTTASFEGMVTPQQATHQRYVVQKGTAATLDFAAVMAQAARVLRPFEQTLPGLADSCLTAAVAAWQWAEQHPAVVYDQEALNQQFDPDITTGAYGDKNFEDERLWAAAELLVTTGQEQYFRAVEWFPEDHIPLPSWAQVRALGYYTLIRQDTLPPVAQEVLPRLRQMVQAMADTLLADVDAQPYGTVMGQSPRDYIWGSSAVAANQGVALLQAYRLTHDDAYWKGAVSNLDYLLGRNATGYSFVTGHGTKTPQHPHHRLSVSDGVEAPVPGLLSGGPNARAPQQDHCTSYTSDVPDETFSDDDCSYASNEIAINWNAPLAYLTGALEALHTPISTQPR
ncbi:endoglucanase [Catalinimonas alkaloidigena]|uniref:Endoglucanase n=1 Tax=Catalinimonas alkaloidigena TaxID=1075417 RepID=A0A1G9AMW4_9BACT|nr:glycoside hydrolase family 9 protein [Catalinimonas alkaloidigena]SDK28164.1 endoglucanase [Catalinimonas alkaloidigena]